MATASQPAFETHSRLDHNSTHNTTLVWVGQAGASRRGSRVLGIATALVLLVGAALASLHAYASSTVRERALSALEQKLGRAGTIADVRLGLSSVEMSNVEIDGLGSIGRVVATYSPGSLLRGTIVIERVDVYGMSLSVAKLADGGTSIDDIVSRFRGGTGTTSSNTSAPGAIPIAFHDVTLIATDEMAGWEAEFTAARLVPNHGAAEITFSLGSMVARGNVPEALRDNGLSEVSGTISYVEGSIRADLGGSFQRSSEEGWRFDGVINPRSHSAAGTVEARNVNVSRLSALSGSRLENVIGDVGMLSADLKVNISPSHAEVRGEARFDGLELGHNRVSRNKIHTSFKARGVLELAREAKSISMSGALVSSHGVEVEAGFSAQLPDPLRENPAATLSATLSVDSVPCQALLDSIPNGLVPNIAGFELRGEMSADVELGIDWADLEKTRFTSSILDPQRGIDNCEVVSAPSNVSADRLRGSFEHKAPVGDGFTTFVVGPENDDYVPLQSVSRHLTRSLMTTEDSRFYRHNGFITKQFRLALIKNLERGRFAYGASSITMQVVKNVMLAREKTVSRKVEELFLTWYLEGELDKDRILEIYVNAIEFGPGVYGITRAAKRYFNKNPRQLNPIESAFFSSILPAPVRRFKQYCRGWAARSTQRKIDRIIDIMFERNRLNEEQYLRAVTTPLVFRGNRREICRQYENGLIGKDSVNARNDKGATQ